MIVLLIILIFIVFLSIKQPTTAITSYCKPNGISNGTDRINIYVSRASSYVVWIHLESPIQINFNDLPGEYNPLLVSVDGKSCYRVGGQPMILNTWTWINYLNNGPNSIFRINLSKGTHTISITGSYVSIDRVELVNGSCVPINEGSNCLIASSPMEYLH